MELCWEGERERDEVGGERESGLFPSHQEKEDGRLIKFGRVGEEEEEASSHTVLSSPMEEGDFENSLIVPGH